MANIVIPSKRTRQPVAQTLTIPRYRTQYGATLLPGDSLPIHSVSDGGRVFDTSQSYFQREFAIPTGPNLPMMLVLAAKRIASSGATYDRLFELNGYDGSQGTPGVGIEHVSDGSLLVTVWPGNGGLYNITQIPWKVGEKKAFCIYAASGELTVFVGGERIGSSAYTQVSSPAKLTIGGATYSGGSTNRGRDFLIHCVHFAIGARLSQGEAQSISRNPWQIFAPEKRVLYFPVSGGSGALSLLCSVGAFLSSGADLAALASRKLPAALAEFSLAGVPASVLAGRLLTPDGADYVLSGGSAEVRAERLVTGEVGAYALSGSAVNLLAARRLPLGSGTFNLTGSDLVLTYNPLGSYSLLMGPGTFSLAGSAASPRVRRTLSGEAGVFQLGASGTELLAGRTLPAAAGAVSLTGIEARTLVRRLLSGSPGSLLVTGSDAALVKCIIMALEAGACQVTGTDAGLVAERILSAAPGEFVLEGADAGIGRVRTFSLDPGAFLAEGVTAEILLSRVLRGSAGVYAVAGAPISIDYSGATEGTAPIAHYTFDISDTKVTFYFT